MKNILFLLFLSCAAQAHPLVNAAERGDLAAVRRMIEDGTCTEVLNEEGETALIEAVDEGHLPVIEYLLKAGADPNFIDRQGETVLHEAIEEDRAPVVELLLKDPRLHINTVEPTHLRTPLMMVAMAGKAAWVEKFIHLGASVGEIDRDGKTALDLAKDASVQKILREHGAK
jgi:ankyrin repeat protein